MASSFIRQDEGLFVPDSVARRVWSYPTSALLGFIRAVTIEHLDPDLTAAVAHSGQVVQRPALRYDRTVQYFATVLFGDAASVIKSSDVLMKVHSRAYGPNPVTGGEYDSNDPASQLWIHMTAWHSILYVYEMYGPGKLSRTDENEYWRECAVAAECQPIHVHDVPRTRGEVQKYFDDWRDRLASSEAAVHNIEFILAGMRTIFTALPAPMRAVMGPVIRAGVIATYPRWMRALMGVRQSRVTDSAVVAVLRPGMAALARSPRAQLWFLERVAPRGGPVLTDHLRGIPAETSSVYSPEQARKKFGDPRTPLEQYADQLAVRRDGATAKPYEHKHREAPLEFAAPAARVG
ncbi:oxygenase MpaB family protein [Rhodococcus sp. IEGM 1408]|uniref:oxygenase MpaB family protein n=1 Tax=Rhodococcus sp. IEGM 1408 TaxID=3082220 RepID=UPI002955C3D1|nr:oxygenase MpaB family protein [Rhodococcus sp. IEGM 1408]MDV8001788.1 oxygenase MpaB family protein [Rhodococcus sp. IEGM 1408]